MRLIPEGCVTPMVLAQERAGDEPPRAQDASAPTRADALRRIAAEVSGRYDLDGLFRDVIDESFALFGVDQAGLWIYDDSPIAAPSSRAAPSVA